MATAQTTTETSEYRYKPEQIDWDTMKNLGLSKEKGPILPCLAIEAAVRALSVNYAAFKPSSAPMPAWYVT